MSIRFRIHRYQKKSTLEDDKEFFEKITKIPVNSWVDNGNIQTVDVKADKDDEEKLFKTIQRVIKKITNCEEFKGWVSFPDDVASRLYYTPCAEINLVDVRFASLFTPFELSSHYSVSEDDDRKIVATFEHDIQRLQVYICQYKGDWSKISVQYDDLHPEILQEIRKDKTVRLVLSFKCTPSFWITDQSKIKKMSSKLQQDFNDQDALEKKVRQKTHWQRLSTLSGDHGQVIPQCSAIVLTYRAHESDSSRIVSGFKKHNFQCFFSQLTEHEEHDKTYDENWIDSLVSENKDLSSDINMRYALKCLESIGYQFLDMLYRPLHSEESFFEFLKQRIKAADADKVAYIVQIIYKIVNEFDKDRFLSLVKMFKSFDGNVRVPNLDEESHYAYVKRIIVTPSRYIWSPPEPIAINRILRKYYSYIDNFARVSFRDEDFSQFNSQSDSATIGVRNVINDGIELSPEIVFKFLGCSNSQLRSQGLWLFYQQYPVTIQSIRDKIGDLTQMKTVQKYVTRMGLHFTATDFRLDTDLQVIDQDDIIETRKYKDKEEEHNFTDGCGCISKKLQLMITDKKYGSDCYYKPVAFQIRIGGCKGMVSLNPELKDKEIVIRSSMKKFESEDMKLELCGYSLPRELYMNRQVISILTTLGVPDSSFITLQNESLIEVADMLIKENFASLEMSNKLRISYRELSESPVRITTEPYLRSQLISLYKFKVRDAIAKTRFRINHSKGRQMKGIVDETGKLDYGEIFVQYTDLSSRFKFRIIHEGDTFVTKNPCLHPGDLQKLTAVNVPELHHLYDVIVFPSHGKRPHPNEMSGSNLDGDEYFVCWEKSLMPKSTYDPAEYYISIKEKESKPPETIDEDKINSFVFNYITKGSKLGQISNAHAIWADREDESVKSERCLRLAEKHSDAVDFIKTGIPATFEYGDRSLIYPDWMMKKDKATYNSKKVTGKMFRVVHGLEDKVLHLDNLSGVEIKCSPLFQLDSLPTEEELNDAKPFYDEYCDSLANIMVAYGIKDEGDIATGCLNTLKMSLARESERNYDMREQCISMFKSLQRKFKKKFYGNIKKRFSYDVEGNSAEYNKLLLRQAAAWYHITYNNPDPHHGLVLLSFPWCVAGELMKIPEKVESRVNSIPNSVRLSLKNNFSKWYQTMEERTCELREKGKDIYDKLKCLRPCELFRDISSYVYGILPARILIYFIDDNLTSFRHKFQAQRHSHGITLSDSNVRKIDKHYFVYRNNEDKIYFTNDRLLAVKVKVLREYVTRYDIIAHPMYAAINWAYRNNLIEGCQEVDIALSFVDYILAKKSDFDFYPVQIPAVLDDINGLQIPEPNKNAYLFYLDYLKWIILGDFINPPSLQCQEGNLLQTARNILSKEKSQIAAMRDYHYISYTLNMVDAESFQKLSILWQREKKTCFTIARATSFCTRYFSHTKNNPGLGEGSDLKIREIELGSVSCLIVELWGDNPQRINDVAEAFCMNDSFFSMKYGYLQIMKENYNQRTFIHRKDFKKKSLNMKWEKRDKLLSQKVKLIKCNDDVKGTLQKVINDNLLMMKDDLYNKISHGSVRISTELGQLKYSIYEDGSLRNVHIQHIAINETVIQNSIKDVAKSSLRKYYIFKILFEGTSYEIKFNGELEPLSISLDEINWSTIMVENSKGLDFIFNITSSHTLDDKFDFKCLPLTYKLYGKTVNEWIENLTEEEISVTDDVPLNIKAVEMVEEKYYSFVKDPSLKDITVSIVNKTIYNPSNQLGSLKARYRYASTIISTSLEMLPTPDQIIQFSEVVLYLATDKINRERRTSSIKQTEEQDNNALSGVSMPHFYSFQDHINKVNQIWVYRRNLDEPLYIKMEY